MNKRITVRLDDDIVGLFSQIGEFSMINLSELTRAALKLYLKNCIDNSGELTSLEKGQKNVL